MLRRTGWLSATALLAIASVAAPQDRLWNAEDRVIITSFNEVFALAFDGNRVYGATRNGLEIYDAIARRWLLPSTAEDGYPVFDRPTAAAYDRTQGGLWLLTATGNTYLWSELNGRWDIRMPGSAPADLLQPSPLANNDPAWRVLRGTITLDPHGRRWPITTVVPSDRPGTYWVATAGGNIIAADTRNLSSDWLTYGTLSRGVSALARDRQGDIWFGGDGYGPRDGLTRADSSLQSWLHSESYSARAPRRAVAQILTGDTTWVAAGDGLYVLPSGARSWQRIDEREGLPSSNVRALVPTRYGVWVGTQQGIAVIDPVSLRGSWRGMPGARINALAERNDTVWIASDVGLWLGVADGPSFKVLAAPGADTRPQLRQRIVSVARVADRIAVLASDGVRLYDNQWSDLAEAAVQIGGRAHDLRADAQRLFVLASNTLAEWDVQRDRWRRLTVPADVPEGPIRDVLRTGDYLWVATPGGAVRLRWP